MDLSQAMLYIYDEAGQKIPVGFIREMDLDTDSNIYFSIINLPIIASDWCSYAAELYFYKKGSPVSILVSGTAVITDYETQHLKFTIQQIGFQGVEEKPAKASYFNFFKYLFPVSGHQQQHHLKLG
ncbi:hypothetical protein DXN05_05425 [Deminuibacter soli]|uniref:Uncharacterized protein n=2 Tax=Deminuibacter soli TaxID=2291815 RepID=A0A3E1NR35_9BACT|nr:hypothetical protein DXN05_05425 [Deminuibacter soli]